MEIRFMKQAELDTLKGSLENIYTNYFTKADGSWVEQICSSPFVKFRDVPDFKLVVPNETLTVGDVDFENCKRVYENLNFLTETQAADERLWAGLCHDVFYDYVRRRYDYGTNKTAFLSTDDDADDEKFLSVRDKEITKIKNRFFFNGGTRECLMKNPLARCWWTGRVFYDEGSRNRFAKLDLLGAKDFYTKVFSTLTRGFVANPKLLNGVVKFLDYCRRNGIEVDADKNLRPALKEVNKVGGAVILDCLTEDDIADIMIACVKPHETSPVKPHATIPADTHATIPADTHETVHADTHATVHVDDTRTVKIGIKVKLVSLDNDVTRDYTISPKFKRQFPDRFNALVGKTINSVVTFRDGKFTITDIQ